MRQRFYKIGIKRFLSAWITNVFLMMIVLILVSPVEARLDPMRIITGSNPPNDAYYIVLDMSGSLAFPIETNPNDSFGTSNGFYYYNWKFSVNGTTCSTSTMATIAADYNAVIFLKKPNHGTGHGYWLLASSDASYSYWYWVPYSRIAGIKNFFGSSIRIYKPSVSTQLVDPCGKYYYQFPVDGGPRQGAYYDYQTASWHNWTSAEEPVPDPIYTTLYEPYKYIENNSELISWGLIIFHNSTAELQVPINLENHEGTIQQFNNAMRALPDGLNPNGGTAINLALNRAKWELSQTYNTDNQGSMRYYASILITDGASNTCNPNDAAWGTGCPGYDDGTTWHYYPTGRSDELFLRLLDQYSSTACKANDAQVQKNMQTFVVGIGPDVSQCELNLTAYFGRTDAHRDDAGRDWLNNPRSPHNTSGTTTLDHYNPAGGNYAFFISTDTLSDTFNKIISNPTPYIPREFAASPPAPVEELPGYVNSVILNSTRYPHWFGGSRKWIITWADQGDGSNHQMPFFDPATWCDNVNDTGPYPQHVIYYSGDRTKQHFHLVWDAACSLNLQYNSSSTTHNRNIYTVATACNIGNSSGPDSNCKHSESNVIKLEKNSVTISLLRKKITNIDWASYDFNKNGIPASIDDNDMLMLIDFILGGSGQVGPNISRFWMLGDIFNSTPVVIETSLPYLNPLNKNIPSRSASYYPRYPRKYKIVYVASNDGMLHAFQYTHDPRDSSTPHDIELFAFVPPTSFPAIAKLLTNYLIPFPPPYSTGQPEELDFDTHIWSLAASPSYSNIWASWYGDGSGAWRTILFLPLGPKSEGMYALDVTNPLGNNPPFDVIWYWNAQGTQDPPITAKEIWNPVSIGLSQAGGNVDGSFRNWIVSFDSIHNNDVAQSENINILKADTGELYLTKEFGPPPYEEFVPFHMYGNAQLIACNPSDGVITHVLSSSTRGSIPALLINKDKTVLWDFNNPKNPINFGSKQPLYHQPASSLVCQNEALLLASISGSIFETDAHMNGSSSTFVTKIMLDLLDIDSNTKNLAQYSPSKQHKEWKLAGDFQVDTNGDGTPDLIETFSPLTRAIAEPIITMMNGDSGGIAYFIIYDPMKFDPEYGLYVGNSYIAPIQFLVTKSSSGGAKVIFTSASFMTFFRTYNGGIMNDITLFNDTFYFSATGPGAYGVCMPAALW